MSELFDAPIELSVDLATRDVPKAAAAAVVERVSISGAQPKVWVQVDVATRQLVSVERGGRFILKPAPATWPGLPANEHFTMQLARQVGIEVPPCGLVRLSDGPPAFVIRRFDRRRDGSKVHVEDFAQVEGIAPSAKYDRGSAERCARVVRRHVVEPEEGLAELYRRWVFIWWTGNSDMHLKNFSLIHLDGLPQHEPRRCHLAPAYDLLSTAFLPALTHPARLALPLDGRDDNLSRGHWRRFGEYCGLVERERLRLIDDVIGRFELALQMLEASQMLDEQKQAYAELLRKRAMTFG